MKKQIQDTIEGFIDYHDCVIKKSCPSRNLKNHVQTFKELAI